MCGCAKLTETSWKQAPFPPDPNLQRRTLLHRDPFHMFLNQIWHLLLIYPFLLTPAYLNKIKHLYFENIWEHLRFDFWSCVARNVSRRFCRLSRFSSWSGWSFFFFLRKEKKKMESFDCKSLLTWNFVSLLHVLVGAISWMGFQGLNLNLHRYLV